MKTFITTLVIAALLGCVLTGSFSSRGKGPVSKKKLCILQQSSELIVNGGFETNQCSSIFCIWSKSNITANDVPGWIPCPVI